MELKEKWKKAGVGTGKAFTDLGKAIFKSVKVGVDKLDSDNDQNSNEDTPKEEINLKEKWSEVGHDFGDAGKSLGQAFVGTAKVVVDKVDNLATDNEDNNK